jgi:hypothetical protein
MDERGGVRFARQIRVFGAARRVGCALSLMVFDLHLRLLTGRRSRPIAMQESHAFTGPTMLE